MLHRRIGYGAVLAAAVLFQITFDGYLSTFVLVLAILFPFLSLALSLPGMRRCSLTVTAAVPEITRGGDGAFVLTLHNPTKLPLSRLRIWYTYVNQLTGEQHSHRRDFRGASQGEAQREELTAPHCGRLVCTIDKARVCDLLGLFSLPVTRVGSAALVVLPEPLSIDIPPELTGGDQQGADLRPRPGGGPGEDYDLRDYRPGDPLRSVHWKLSSKRDDLVVRETLEPHRAPLALTWDHFGPPEELDAVFARLYALSRGLLKQDRSHYILWADPDTGGVQCRGITCTRDLAGCLEAAFSTAAPPAGKSILDCALRIPGESGAVRHLHIRPHGEGGAV